MRLALLPRVSQLTFIPYIYIRFGFLFLILSHQTDSINSSFDQTHLQSQPFTMSDDQSRPITQKPNETSPTSRHSIMLLTTSAIGAALLFLSGLTLTGTVISLVIATPVLILFSPILFPTGIIIFLATAGFLFSGGCGVAAAAALAWLYNYIAGKRRCGAVAEQLDYARMRIASRARDMRERAREYGQKVQQNKAQSQEVKMRTSSHYYRKLIIEIAWRSSCAKVYKHVSVAWYRSLVISLALITPLHSGLSSEIQVPNPSDLGSESSQQRCVDLQTNELWNSYFEDPNHLKYLETKWNPLLSKIKNVIIKKASEQDMETAATLLRCSYNLSRDISCAVLPSSVNLYVVPFLLATAGHYYPGFDGVNVLDLNIPQKLLLWAYTLLHGHYMNIPAIMKYCEENAKSKMKKGSGSSSVPSITNTPAAGISIQSKMKKGSGSSSVPSITNTPAAGISIQSLMFIHNADVIGGGKDGASKSSAAEAATSITVASTAVPKNESSQNTTSASLPESESAQNVASALLEGETTHDPTGENHTIFSATPNLLRCNNNVEERSNLDVHDRADLGKG
ncbi:hypothetical protein TEA_010979 [Camellia sinensis var. sinensis]|uniref:Oleosin n=1 Tax=Camellia sinensis var. sinensis TaxID=542762 RepID=A0A4S4ESJ6_CAMSN|nr:hypothetical protein TEA_010979 [Camellia sinensis var. sinensis]